jgi:hypothetical protein
MATRQKRVQQERQQQRQRASVNLLEERLRLEAKIEDLKTARDAETNPKLRSRLNNQAKAQQRKLDDLNQRDPEMRTGIDPKGGSRRRIPTVAGEQAHHAGTSLNNARPFFSNLDEAGKLLMNREFAKFGLVPADVAMNRLDMLQQLHQAGIHGIERDLGLEGKTYFPENATLEQKLKAVTEFAEDQRYLKSIAERAQFRATQELGGLSRRVMQTATPELADEFHRVRAQQAAEMTRDIREYGPMVHQTVGGQQWMPDISGRPNIDLYLDEKLGKASYTIPEGAAKPRPTKPPIKQHRIGSQLRIINAAARMFATVDYDDPAEAPFGSQQINMLQRSVPDVIQFHPGEYTADLPGV